MATLYISYFGTVVDGVAGDQIASETVTTGASNANSGNIPAGTRAIKLNSDTATYFQIATTPDATTAPGRSYLAANETVWLHFPTVSGTYKIGTSTSV